MRSIFLSPFPLPSDPKKKRHIIILSDITLFPLCFRQGQPAFWGYMVYLVFVWLFQITPFPDWDVWKEN